MRLNDNFSFLPNRFVIYINIRVNGWTYTLTQNNKKISLLRYYSNRLHFRDKYGPIYYDYVLHAGLLSHQYIIDSWIKTEENRLHWLFHNQEKLRADFYRGTVNTNSQLTKLNNFTYFCPEQNLISRCRRCITCGGQWWGQCRQTSNTSINALR